MDASAERQLPSALFVHRSVDDALLALGVQASSSAFQATGLSHAQVADRRLRWGFNELAVVDDESLWWKFAEQFKNPLIYLLLISVLVSLLTGEFDNAVSITLAIIIVVAVAFVQEYRSEKSLDALNKLVPHFCQVLRNGAYMVLPAIDLVPGDIVTFKMGDRIPADVRLLSTVDLHIDESSLTGETNPVKKTSEMLPVGNYHETLSVPDRINISYMGTLVRHGSGIGVVIGTGKSTEFGAVFVMMKEVEVKRTALQHRMDELGKQLSIASFGIIGIILLVGVLQGRKLLEMFTVGVSLAVAAIPEGLPIVVTVTLALGVLRMADKKAIVKKLPSVESLGSVNVLCLDKTGTITQNQMTVRHLYTLDIRAPLDARDTQSIHRILEDSSSLRMLIRAGNLCNNAHYDSQGSIIGQSTECALLQLLYTLKISDDRQTWTRLTELPFSSDIKYMSVLCSPISSPLGINEPIYFIKGALEKILPECYQAYVTQNETITIDTENRHQIQQQARVLEEKGLRVLALAMAYSDSTTQSQQRRSSQSFSPQPPQPYLFLGIMSIYDPPRLHIDRTIAALHKCGIRVIMITGDSNVTANAIAREVGLRVNGLVTEMSGREVNDYSLRALTERAPNVSVFYRMSPGQKMKVVQAYQDAGFVVAMTGDGVNDAPALRLSNIGISMGQTGTDVSKEAADMILVNDDLSTILCAIEEGKSIFHNIQNFLRFQLSTSLSALALIAIATFIGLPNPLNAMQILWINIIMDGPPAQSLGVEPIDEDVINEPPRARDAAIITSDLIVKVVTSAAIIVCGTMWVYWSELSAITTISTQAHTERVTTMTFTAFVFFDMFNALSCRSQTKSLFHIGFFGNRMFNIAIGLSLVGQLLVIYFAPFQRIFQTVSLSLVDITKLVVLTSSVWLIDELRKLTGNQQYQHGGILNRIMPRMGLPKMQQQYEQMMV